MSVNRESIRAMTWNIQSGGFDSYTPDTDTPEREGAIKSFIATQKNLGVKAVGLTDALRWNEVYGGDAGIASHLGYQDARFVPINDDRIDRDVGSGIGVAFATDLDIEQSRPLDLDTRQGLNVILDVGSHGLQVATAYLDDMNQGVRERQIRALMDDLEPDMPTLLMGDFNMLRPNLFKVSFSAWARDLALKSLGRVHPNAGLRTAILEMDNRRTGPPLVESYGFVDADAARMRPTAPAKLPAFGIDYMYSRDLDVGNVQVKKVNGASDHLALVADFRA